MSEKARPGALPLKPHWGQRAPDPINGGPGPPAPAGPGQRPGLPSVWRAAATVSAWTAASRVCGFLRDIALAATLGSGPAADAFLVALKLPNLFRRAFGEGAFAAAFVPEFTHLAQHDRAAAARLTARLAGLLVLGLGLLVLAGEAFMPALMHAFAPGFAVTPPRLHLAVALTRWTFPYLLLVCLGALLGSVLNGLGRFAVPAAMPVLFNLILILMLLTRPVAAARAAAIGVLLAGLAQLAVLTLATRRAGMPIRPALPALDPSVRRVLRRLGPGLVGAGVTQLNVTVGVVIASLLPQGTVAALYYADRVAQLPLGLIGMALGTALLPSLSRDRQGAGALLNRALELAMALTLPAAAALMVAALPITSVLFGRGAFGAEAVRHSAAALTVYAAGLPAIVLGRLFATGSFAAGDTATPVRCAAAAVAVNLALGLGLISRLGFLAPAVSFSVAAWVNAVLLGAALRRRTAWSVDAALARRLPRMLAAASLMALALAGARRALAPWLFTQGPPRWAALCALVGAGLLVFGAAGQGIGAFDARRLRAGWRGERPPTQGE